jgi:hypothetical protein
MRSLVITTGTMKMSEIKGIEEKPTLIMTDWNEPSSLTPDLEAGEVSPSAALAVGEIQDPGATLNEELSSITSISESSSVGVNFTPGTILASPGPPLRSPDQVETLDQIVDALIPKLCDAIAPRLLEAITPRLIGALIPLAGEDLKQGAGDDGILLSLRLAPANSMNLICDRAVPLIEKVAAASTGAEANNNTDDQEATRTSMSASSQRQSVRFNECVNIASTDKKGVARTTALRDPPSAVDNAWGELFDGRGQPTPRLRRVLMGLANFLVRELPSFYILGP